MELRGKGIARATLLREFRRDEPMNKVVTQRHKREGTGTGDSRGENLKKAHRFLRLGEEKGGL